MRAFGVNVSISKFGTFICFKCNFKSRNSFDLSHLRWAFLNQATSLLEPISSTKPLSIVKYVGDHCLVTSSSNLILWRLNVGPTLLISIMLIMNIWLNSFKAELMWGSMDEEVKTTYGKSYFDQKVRQRQSFDQNVRQRQSFDQKVRQRHCSTKYEYHGVCTC